MASVPRARNKKGVRETSNSNNLVATNICTLLMKVSSVKNKAPAEVQITAEQLLREASEKSKESSFFRPRQKVTDAEEAAELRQIKRKGFEDALRRNRSSIGTWLKYASYEEQLREYARARSLYERALEVDPRNIVIWLKYAEMEMKHRNINHARNIWNRAVTLLPFVEQFWYKYAYFEEMLGNISGARQIFERWMEWQPKEMIWSSYIKMESRYKEYDNVRTIFERMVKLYPTSKNWIKYAKFEDQLHEVGKSRAIYERAIEELPSECYDSKLFLTFAKFEIRQKEIERARIIFQYALEVLKQPHIETITNQYIQFEKQHGKRDEMEHLIIKKRRDQYEKSLQTDPFDYNTWFDYIHSMETDYSYKDDHDPIISIYERAIQMIPNSQEKSGWKRYIYIWISYAIFLELDCHDKESARRIYKRCIDIIPHSKFTFSKIWILYSKFLIRCMELTPARKLLGSAIGQYPKSKLFKEYIDLELELREFDRCRILYQKYILFQPSRSHIWIKYAELEQLLDDLDRVRAIYELAVEQPILDVPELIWKSYIDFEKEQGNTQKVRELYERLLEKSEHIKIWQNYAQFEMQSEDMEACRNIMERGEKSLKIQNLNDDRAQLLQYWLELEEQYQQSNGVENEYIETIRNKLPKRVSKKDSEGKEIPESMEWIFPEDVSKTSHSKLLELAYKWKEAKTLQ